MTKTVCDICGKEMQSTKFVSAIENLNFCISSHGRTWDICNKCREGFNSWMFMRRLDCKAEGENLSEDT